MAIEAHDIVSTSPTNTFATWNPLDKARDNTVLSDGNLASTDTSSGYAHCYANIVVPTTGLYYVEFTIKTFGSSNAVGVYIGNYRDWANIYGTTGYAYDANTFMIMHNGYIYSNGSTQFGYHPTFTTGDVVALIIDGSSRNIWVQKNGNVISGDNYASGSQSGGVVGALSAISALPDGDIYVFTMQSGAAAPGYSNSTIVMNAGQDSSFGGVTGLPTAPSGSPFSDANGLGEFYYAPPTGALALCTANIQSSLAIDPAEDDVPEDFFKCTLYSGSTSTLNHDTGLKADFVWIKKRSGVERHVSVDSVRGGNSTSNFLLYPDMGVAQEYDNVNNHNWLTLTSSSTANSLLTAKENTGMTNENGHNYVCWAWRAGGSPSGSNIYMKDGTGYTNSTSDKATVFGSASNYTITPTSASIGVKQGFGVYTFTASTGNTKLPHGLGKAPEFVIIKSTNTASTNWVATFPALGDDLYLNTAGARINGTSAGAYFQTTADADAITFGLQSTTYSNKPSLEYVVYAFTSIEGFSAFGSYTSVGATSDSNFVFLGFKPALVILKATGAVSGFSSYISWVIYDNARQTANPNHSPLFANKSVSEGYRGNGTTSTGGNTLYVDFLSNGFKIRSEAAEYSGANTNPIIFAAWAEMPYKYSVAK